MQLVVPMAGLGQRFVEAGYRQPKPLIDVHGSPMIVRVVEELPQCERIVFVVHGDHVRDFGIDRTLRRRFSQCEVIVTPGLTAGQACTVRLAAEALDPSEPVLVAACDNSHLYDAERFRTLTAESRFDCLIWTYRNDFRVLANPRAHGWVRVAPNGVDVLDVFCKQPLSTTPLVDHAVTGCFWFRSAKKMMSGIDRLVASNQRVNGEFYLDVVPNMLIADGAAVGAFEVDKYIGWGTPRDLEDYLRWRRYFENAASPAGSLTVETVEKRQRAVV